MRMKGSCIVLLATCFMGSGVSAFAPSSPTRHLKETRLYEATTLDGEEIRGPITPLGNFVLVRTKDALSATAGGILLPDQVCMYGIQLLCLFHIIYIYRSCWNVYRR